LAPKFRGPEQKVTRLWKHTDEEAQASRRIEQLAWLLRTDTPDMVKLPAFNVIPLQSDLAQLPPP
jgi:hypothetical protein